ncbi:MAG TPA: PPOX class F420-dependent oxidoreductase [Roseiflexaceae bacterium]|nr:PPOX class F420-dependent oxidoreductase [Roseiflexaceae bacterium]
MTQVNSVFSMFAHQQFMNLTTFRKNGHPMPTPVWFAQEGDRLVVMTTANAGKIKRIRAHSRVEIGPCDRRGMPLGPSVPATARILSAAEGVHADRLLSRKYGLMKWMFDAFGKLRGMPSRAYIEIVPGDGVP